MYIYIFDSVLTVASDIHWGSWDLSLMVKGSHVNTVSPYPIHPALSNG